MAYVTGGSPGAMAVGYFDSDKPGLAVVNGNTNSVTVLSNIKR